MRTFVLTMLAACGGGGSSTTIDAPIVVESDAPADAGSGSGSGSPYTYTVDAAHGDDGAAGSVAAPWKTITHALGAAHDGESIHALPGTYDAANGEVNDSLIIPAGVSLIGDEATRGATTTVAGYHLANASFITGAIELADRATLAGFTVKNTDPSSNIPIEVFVFQANGATVRANTLTASGYGIEVLGAGTGPTGGEIAHNTLTNQTYNGLIFINGGVGMKVEHNTMTGNLIGVEYDSAGGDLGGGAAGSVGDNLISCNTKNDLWSNTQQITIDAANNRWDHVPPTVSMSNQDGMDIENGGAIPITLTGATVAASPCL